MSGRCQRVLWAGSLIALLSFGCNDGGDGPVSPTPPLSTATPTEPIPVDPTTTPSTPTDTASGETPTATSGSGTPTAAPPTPTAAPTPSGASTPTAAPSPSEGETPTGGITPTPAGITPTPAGITPTPGTVTPTPAPTPTATDAPTPTTTDCGNGQLDAGEDCDDGDRDSGDGCSDTCTLEDGFYCQGSEPTTCIRTICGDGVKTPNEACDDGDANSDLIADACRTDCTLPGCGDGIKDQGELCDDGPDNSDSDPNSCRTDCSLPGCGDGLQDLGEQCDDGEANSDIEGDACRSNCTLPRCGDGVRDSEEACDEGLANSDTLPDSCRRDCSLPTCGDGTVDTDERCDNGDLNSDTEPGACRTSCVPAACGDGVLDTGEQCDEGVANSDDLPGACRTTCRLAGCGDGVLDEGEACDEGASNSDSDPDACRSTCDLPECGDGVVDSGETCDEGALNSDTLAGACRTTCEQPTCGDGVTDPGEGCDDGNTDNTDECSNSCAATGCGDGFLNDGEECDDGELNSDEDPDACRTTCVLPSCGDDVLDEGEACDEGGGNSDVVANACRGDCALPSCGDDVRDAGEECDEGADNSVDGLCSPTCTVNIDYEEVLVMGSNGAVLEGSWDDFYDRITEDVSDCKVRFDGRIAQVDHVEYATNSIFLDFQPLAALYNGWDAYAYIHLNKGIRAGLGASYRRGLTGSVALKDRTQHAESEFTAMNVTVMCPRVSGYEKVATFNTRGEVTDGSYARMREMIVERGATCKIRADRRVLRSPNIEYDGSRFYFDALGLEATYDSWDAYAYGVVDLNMRAGIGASLRRGHGDVVALRDRIQQPESYFLATVVDVYCADDHESVVKMLYNGRLIEGDWEDLWYKATEEGRSCKFRFDERISTPEYMEYLGGNLRFDFAGLHAHHDSYDAYAYMRLIQGGQAGLGTSYRRGHQSYVHLQSLDQHGGDEFTPLITEVFCESSARWEHVHTLDANGTSSVGTWADLYDRIVTQGADCKLRYDGRIGLPPLVEFTEGYLLFDHLSLAAKHDGWDSYATHVIARDASSGIASSYRRGHDDLVWQKDRAQNSLYNFIPMETEFLCRRPPGLDPSDALCGDGDIDPGEACDDGAANSNTAPNACRADCSAAICGDGVVDAGEECDAGDANADDAGSACSTTCTVDLDYERVLSMTGDGTVTFGDFTELYERVTEQGATCKVRFDDRVAQVNHIEYSSNNLFFDLQGLAAIYNAWDSYAYLHLYKGNRAGLGASYRRGLTDSVSLKDRVQHAESEFYPMPVDVYCERVNPYQLVASFNTSGQATNGSYAALHRLVTEEGASCKVRVDRRIMTPEHVEYGDNSIYFDAQNLSATYDSWDAYAYVHIDQEVRAGIGASLRRGHDDNITLRDRRQYAESRFDRYPVDVYCADTYAPVATLTRDGEVVEGDWDDLFTQVTEEGRACKVAFDRRLAPVEYTEFYNGDLRMEFHRLHAHHDSYDSLAYALLSQGGTTGIGATYRRGHQSYIWQRSLGQHGGGDFFPRQLTVFCEDTARWDHSFELGYDGIVNRGDWETLHRQVTEQVRDCKLRMDGRILDPALLEFTETELLFDQATLAAKHDGWDSYATNVLRWEDDSGIASSYRRGHDDLIWAKDRKQNSLYNFNLFDLDLLCRGPLADAPAGPVCGDGRVDLGEACDDGDGNSNEEGDACRLDCQLPTCGDGVVDAGEACDEGAANSDDVGATCATTCVEAPYYERVLRMAANGTVLAGSWDDAFSRVTEGAADCKVRFDERVARVEHVEYSTNNLLLDFQPLSAFYNTWDAYAYIHLSQGSRAGLGASYRRGLTSTVHLKDRVQHAEAEFTGMTVDLFCPRVNPYQKVASISSSGQFTEGSWEDLRSLTEDLGAQCRIRADKRVMAPQHIEFLDGRIYFDMLGLSASYDSWDAYAFADIEVGVKAGLSSSLRRGHDDHVTKKDRAQYAADTFLATPVDVYCDDRFDPILTMESSGTVSDGDWNDAYAMVAEEMRTCKVAVDDRLAQVPYTEFYNGNLRMEFTPLHAYHDGYDSFAYANLSPSDSAGLGASYRRGHQDYIAKRSLSQHGGGDYFPQTTTLYCEREADWQHVLALSYDGTIISGSWVDLYRRLVRQAGDCKVVFDGRVGEPSLVEYREGELLLDYANLAAAHDRWDAYATHPALRGGTSGIAASYRRGHDDLVWKQDRDQNGLYALTPFDLDFYCR